MPGGGTGQVMGRRMGSFSLLFFCFFSNRVTDLRKIYSVCCEVLIAG